MKFQLQLDKLQREAWIMELAPWEVTATFTFRWEASLDSARRCYERWMRRKLSRLSYFYSIEENPSRDGHHVHSLWAGCRGVYRKEAWASWFERYGRARIEPARKVGDCADYAAKYLCKPNAWWNVKLQWDRQQRLAHGEHVLALAGECHALPVPTSLPDRHFDE